MGTEKSTDELIELQDEDDGEPDETVYTTNKRWSTHYHDSEDCRLLARTDSLNNVTREKAQMKWLGPCPVCVLEESQ